MAVPVFNFRLTNSNASVNIPAARGLTFANGTLTTDGAGNATFTAPSTTPGGSSGQLQFNSGGVFAGLSSSNISGNVLTLTAPLFNSPALVLKGTTSNMGSVLAVKDTSDILKFSFDINEFTATAFRTYANDVDVSSEILDYSNGRWKSYDPITTDYSYFGYNATDSVYDFDRPIRADGSQLTNLPSQVAGSSGQLQWRNGSVFAGAAGSVVTTRGQLTLAPTAGSSGVLTALTLTGAANTGQTAGTEVPDVLFNLNRTVTWAAGALTNQRFVRFRAPTMAFASASTCTTAATVAIEGPPTAGTNATITNPWALLVESGSTKFAGSVLVGDVRPASGTVLNLYGDTAYSPAKAFSDGQLEAGQYNLRGVSGFYLSSSRMQMPQANEIGWTADNVNRNVAIKPNATGVLEINNGTAGSFAALRCGSPAAGTVGVIVKGFTSQTADLQQLQGGDGTVVGGRTKDGRLYYGSSYSAVSESLGGYAYGLTLNMTGNDRPIGVVAAGADASIDFKNTNTGGKHYNFGSTGSGSGAGSGFIVYNVSDGHLAFCLRGSESRCGVGAIGTATPDGQLGIYPRAATTAGLVVKGYTSQTADLTQWQDSSSVTKTWVTAGGVLTSSVGMAPYRGSVTNVVIGSGAGVSLTSGSSATVIIGNGAGAAMAGQHRNVFIGDSAGATCTADENTLVGWNCGSGLVGNGSSTGYGNTAVGANISFSSGSINNMVFGRNGSVTGNDNILFGANVAIPTGFTQRTIVYHMGTTVPGMRPDVVYTGYSSTTNNVPMLWVACDWADSTHATRKTRSRWSMYDTVARECLRIEASGSAAMIGFLGANAVVRQTVSAAATDPTTTQTLANDLRTALINLGLCT